MAMRSRGPGDSLRLPALGNALLIFKLHSNHGGRSLDTKICYYNIPDVTM